jgi:hypothetical protein
MKFILLIILLLPQMALSQDLCSTPVTKEELVDKINEIKAQYFPELNQVELKLEILKSDAYFLQTCIHIPTALRAPLKRTYGIQVNENVFKCSPSSAAIKAILIHEISHINDYTKMSGGKLIRFALKYATNKKFRTRYERETDETALKGGQAQGLKEYRDWVYQWLSPKQLEIKKRYYYTPEEIDQWLIENH